MMIALLAWRNLWRQPQRTLLSLASIVFTAALLVFMLSFQVGVYAAMTSNMLRIFDGFAELQAHGYTTDPDMHKTIAMPERLVGELRSIEGVNAASPRINAFAILASGSRSYGSAVIGVDPEQEARVSSLPATMRQGRYLKPGDTAAAVLGDGLARDLKLSVGGRVTLLGSALDGSVAADVLNVTGVFHSGLPDLDRQILEMPIGRAQATFGFGDRANTIAVSGPSLSDVNDALPQIATLAARRGVDLADWGSLEPWLRDTITLKYMTSAFIYAILVVIVVFIILNTLLMSVLERTREFGVLLALGMRPTAIGAVVWLELVALSVVGNLFGILLGVLVTLWFQRHGILYAGLGKLLAQFGMPERLYPALSALSALVGPGAILLGVLAAGLVPYLYVRKLDAASAMRSP
jgi:ABC-type lipoprotein release transport system permease subunit